MRIIQMGVGGFGQAWTPQLVADKRVKMVGFVDMNPKALTAVCLEHGFTSKVCFSSLDEALCSVQADALVCVTPPEHHRKPVMQALKHGLHVICEKPMAHSLTDCRAMVRCAAETGRILSISQNYRYSPVMRTLAETISRGVIGEIGQVNIDYFMGVHFGDGFRARMPYPLVIDMAVHHFDLIRHLTGLDAVSVRGEAWNPPWSENLGDSSCSVVFEMSNGARVAYTGSWVAKGTFCDWNGNWHIEGSKGALVCSMNAIRKHKVSRYYEPQGVVDVPIRPRKHEDQAAVLDEFIRSVRAGRQPLTNAADNLKSAVMVFSTVKALETGRRIRIPR